MNHRFITKACITLCASFLLAPILAFAMYYPYPGSSNAFEATQAYSVVLRGNGETVAYALLTIPNTNSSQLQSVTVKTNGQLENLEAYQQIITQPTPYPLNSNGSKPAQNLSYPYYSEPSYQKVAATFTGGGYTLTLATPVEAQKSLQLLISYSSMRYVKNMLGLHSYSFPTLGISMRSQIVTVNVDVDTDQYLRGKKSTVNYNTEVKSPLLDSGLSAQGTSKMSSLSQSIGYGSGIQKQFSEVAPGETVTVTGDYANSWLRLYLNTILEVVLLALALLAGLGYVFQKLRTCTKSLADNSLYIIGLSSIVSVILAISSITGVIFIENLFNQSYGYNQYTPLLFSLLGLVLVCAFLLAPPLYIGISRSPKLGFYTFLSQIVLLFIFGVIGIAILFTFFSSNRAIQQYQLPMSASNTVSPQGIGSVLPK